MVCKYISLTVLQQVILIFITVLILPMNNYRFSISLIGMIQIFDLNIIWVHITVCSLYSDHYLSKLIVFKITNFYLFKPIFQHLKLR